MIHEHSDLHQVCNMVGQVGMCTTVPQQQVDKVATLSHPSTTKAMCVDHNMLYTIYWGPTQMVDMHRSGIPLLHIAIQGCVPLHPPARWTYKGPCRPRLGR